MASDRAPLLRPSPTDGNDDLEKIHGAPSSPADLAIGSRSGGGGTRDVSTNTARTSTRGSGDWTRVQAERANAEDDELTEEEPGDEEEARDRDPRNSLPRSAAAARGRRSPRVAASAAAAAATAAVGGRKTAALVAAAGVCLLVVGASVGVRARFRRAPAGQERRAQGSERGGDTVAASLGDGLPLPQCYSATTADPSVGAWRSCDGGAGECSPMGNSALPDWMPKMEGRYAPHIERMQ